MSYKQYERWKREPLTEEPYLSIIIPAYNEEERIIPTIGAIASHISDMGMPWELIIADDGSTDQTIALVEGLAFANLRLLKAERNGGKGSAVRRGMLAARGQYLLFSDADNSTPIEEIHNLLAKLESGAYDLAVGSRAVVGAAEGHKSWLRHILSGGLRSIVRHVLQIDVRDTQCGFKLYTREAGHRLHTAQTLMGFSFDLELLYLARRMDYRVAEVPVKWVDAPGSKVNMAKEVRRFLRDLLQIKWNDINHIYQI